MFSYFLLNKPDIDIKEEIIDKIFKEVSNIVNKKQKWILNIVFLDDDSIKNLNKKYRNIDKTTDVLSFHYFDDFSNLKNEDIAWEIVMSINKIKSQAKEYAWTEEQEFYKLLIHSILHILGYDHEEDNDYTIMHELEKRIFKEVFEK